MSGLTETKPVVLVRIAKIRAALVRLKETREYYQYLSANAFTDPLVVESARDSFSAALKEFGWQWDNVEAVLDALAPEEKLP